MLIYNASRHGGTNPIFNEALAAGSGLSIAEDGAPYAGGGWAGFGSPHTWGSLRHARKNGDAWIYGDHGYFHRGTYYRITRNAFQHDGCGEARREPGVTIAPWRKRGAHVLVCPPDDKIAALMGFDHHAWRHDVLARLAENTDRMVIVRPRAHEQVRPLEADLADAWALVTWGSNAAVEAVLVGVPVFCTGDCSASIMGRSDPINIEYPLYPDDRYEWAATLAANQWTLDEIASGMAWSALRDGH
jgi:hypothetical protein